MLEYKENTEKGTVHLKWTIEDIEMYAKAKDYIDTIILPLYPISFESDMVSTVEMTEFISLMAVQIERQFKGRILMLPAFPYILSSEGDVPIHELFNWEAEIYKSGFKHLFYLTSDSSWRTFEDSLSGSLIFLPEAPNSLLDPKYRNTILEDQVKQVYSLFTQKWQQIEQR